MKDIRVKGNSKPWFDRDIMEAMLKRQIGGRFVRTKLHVYHERFKEQHNLVQQKIKNKKTNFIKNELQKKKNIKKPKELCKVLKKLACLLKQPKYQNMS